MVDELNGNLTYPMVPVTPARQRDELNRRDNELSGNKGEGTRSEAAGEEKSQDSVSFSQESQELAKLARRDREVRAHEAAHAAMGGAYAGSPSFTYKKGSDGQNYAIGGEVPIDVSPISGDPQATLKKAETVRAAALAPAQPSAADRNIAAKASQMAANARTEILSSQSPSSFAIRNNGETSAVSETPATRQAVLRAYGPPQVGFQAVSIPAPGTLLNTMA